LSLSKYSTEVKIEVEDGQKRELTTDGKQTNNIKYGIKKIIVYNFE